jgi:multicomponent K+:H+ antiporter subunit D
MLSTLVIAGLPPLSGFVGKVAMLSALLDPQGPAASGVSPKGWMLFAMLIGSGLIAMIALSRVGIRQFWATHDLAPPRLRIIECLPIGLLLAACVLLVVHGDAVLRYMTATAEALQRPAIYIDAVMGARPVRTIPGSTP